MMVHSLNFCPRIIWLMSFAWLWNCFYASSVIVEKTTDTFFTCLHRMVKRLDSIFYSSNFSWIEIGVSYFHHVLMSFVTNSGRLSETRVFGTPNIAKIANRLFLKVLSSAVIGQKVSIQSFYASTTTKMFPYSLTWAHSIWNCFHRSASGHLETVFPSGSPTF